MIRPTVALILALACSPAFADDAPAGDTDDTTTTKKELAGVEEVVVTAPKPTTTETGTKTDTPLIEVPQAISVIPKQRIEEQDAQTLQAALRYSTGVRSDAYGFDSRGDWAFIRGTDFTQYLDGLRMLYGYYNSTRPEPYTLERAEVMRGPSSVLYGQGTTGGTVDLQSKMPLATTMGELEAQYGTSDRKQLQADLSGPISSDTHWRYRVVVLGRKSDTPVDFVPDDRVVVAPSVTWAPDDRTSFTILGSYQDDHTGSSTAFLPHSGVLLPNPNGKIPFSRFVSEPGFDAYDTKQASIGWKVAHRISSAWSFQQVVRFTEADASYQTLYPDTYANPDDPFIDPDKRVLNRYIYVSKPHIETLGLDQRFLAHFDSGSVRQTLLMGLDLGGYHQTGRSGFDLSTPIDVFAPVYGNYTAPQLFDDAAYTQSQAGLYVQDQVKLADRYVLLAGLREDYAKSKTAGSPDAVQEDWATTGRIGFVYLAPNGWAPYVSYAQSFLPVAGTDFYGNAFVPQRGQQLEAGLKYEPPNAGYMLTAALFDIEDRNRLTGDPANPLNSLQTGEVRSRGIELEGTTSLRGDYDVIATYSYTNAEVVSSNVPGEIGKQLESVPKNLASAWGTKLFRIHTGGLRAGLGVRYVGSSIDSTGTLKTPDVTLADAMLSWEMRGWKVALNATNLTDKQYVSTCLARGDCFVGTGRTAAIRLSYHY